MKKLFLLPLFAMIGIGGNAQTTSLNENFNTIDSATSNNFNAGGSNTLTTYFPTGWYSYADTGLQQWYHYSQYGVNGSPCMEANGYYKGNYANVQWLTTPALTLSGYSSNIYLNFFALYLYAGDSLHIMASTDYAGAGTDPENATWTELTHPSTNMVDDSTAFRQFQVDLSNYKTAPVYIGFKYVSSETDGSRWNLDSVFTTTTFLPAGDNSIGGGTGGGTSVKNVSNVENLPLTVIGYSTSNKVAIEYVAKAGQYAVAVYDMLGRNVYNENIVTNGGSQRVTISNANFASGMYVVKMSNANTFGVTKFTVQ